MGASLPTYVVVFDVINWLIARISPVFRHVLRHGLRILSIFNNPLQLPFHPHQIHHICVDVIVIVVIVVEVVVAVVDRVRFGLAVKTWCFMVVVVIVVTASQRQFWLVRGTLYVVGSRMALGVVLVETRSQPFSCSLLPLVYTSFDDTAS